MVLAAVRARAGRPKRGSAFGRWRWRLCPGNGWMRPEDASNEVLHLSRRSRMTLRVPKHRIDDAHALTGNTLDIGGHRLEVGAARIKLFTTLPTQFARYVAVPEGIAHDDEDAFMEYGVDQLRKLGIQVRKLLCGRTHSIQHADGELFTRSMMLADLEVEEAVTLQQQGIGEHKKIGCGLFIPHKGIKAVHDAPRHPRDIVRDAGIILARFGSVLGEYDSCDAALRRVH